MSPIQELTVDVVLPLAAPGFFTYTLPAVFVTNVCEGSRVAVPFGKHKTYTAIVIRCPGTPPSEDIVLKAVIDVVDNAPLLRPQQMELWRWMTHYYMCTPGEVMKAALPSGLKLESETFVEKVENFTPPTLFSERDSYILSTLQSEKAITIADLQKKHIRTPGFLAALRRLMELGAIKTHEKIAHSYRPHTERHFRFTEPYTQEAAQHELLNTLGKRSPRQTAIILELIEKRTLSRKILNKMLEGTDSALTALRKKGIIEAFDVETARIKTSAGYIAKEERPPLSKAQRTAYNSILENFKKKNICLLHGVTSSGKTEIYIELIRREIAAGRQVLFLLPEIALTTQITTRLGNIFGDKMGVYHSKFPDARRVELWLRQLSDRAFPLILGVRSSLFLPFHNLGLVIVDEEHETSYKQQDPAPRYNARDTAIILAQQYGAKVLLGTATPAIETYYKAAVTKKYGLVTLTERYGGVCLPEIIIEDIKELRRKKLMKTPFSPRLIKEVNKALEAGEQAILFHNRRGYAPVMECHSCGWTPHCKACDVPLTFHQSQGKLVCHYCGASYNTPQQCPNCEESHLRDIGYGTEKIEETVKQCLPEARTARMDLDTTRSRSAYEKIIRDFQQGQTNLLIGTQMVTKGLDFDNVRIVGILNADQMLNQPNFRAYERAYQMMAQVAGRSGRRGKRGTVVLQTRQPDMDIVKQVVENNYNSMFHQQLVEREIYHYPPFVRLIDICFKHRTEQVCAEAAEHYAALLRPHFHDDLLGPDRPVVGRVQHLHLRKVILKVRPELPSAGVRRTLLAARQALQSQPNFRNVSIHFDVDPL